MSARSAVMHDPLRSALAVSAVTLLPAGAVTSLLSTRVADGLWVAATAVGLAYSIIAVAESIRRHVLSVDIIAVLALAGALAVAEPLAGALITLMLATGAILDARADARARRDLSLLIARTPTFVRRVGVDGVEEIPLADVARGDRLVVAAGEVVPVDGRLLVPGTFDESTLTGEPLPVERGAGESVRSGVVNAGDQVELLATTVAADSTYAAIVRLVEEAQASSAPFVRFADRMAIVFVPFTLLAAGAAWVWGGSATRAVAVLVVATPCPLLLAAPIAIMSGLSRAARRGVIIKGGGSLERLANGRTVLLDKTGTLTAGRPEVSAIVTAGSMTSDEVLGYAAALDQVSPHVIASGIVVAAQRRGLTLPLPTEVREEHGYGISGRVDGHEVRVGKADWIVGTDPPPWALRAGRRAALDDSLCVFVAVDGVPAGALLLEDHVRPDAARTVRSLRRAGIGRIVLLTGDRGDVADAVGRVVGVDAVRADCDPAAKLAAVTDESRRTATIMVGDGVNDAPALAAAGAGVALAARGTTASSEAADVVLTVDSLDALADAMLIARRSRRIGWRAAGTGMALSVAAMGFAAAGWLQPAPGAVLQEFIDVLAISIALVALVPPGFSRTRLDAGETQLADEQRITHEAVLSIVDEVRDVADGLSTQRADLAACRRLLADLDRELVPHELSDEQILVPLLAKQLGGREATASLSRAHAEIAHYVERLRRLLDMVASHTPDAADVVELRRILYGLYAVLRLHNAIEDEMASALTPASIAG